MKIWFVSIRKGFVGHWKKALIVGAALTAIALAFMFFAKGEDSARVSQPATSAPSATAVATPSAPMSGPEAARQRRQARRDGNTANPQPVPTQQISPQSPEKDPKSIWFFTGLGEFLRGTAEFFKVIILIGLAGLGAYLAIVLIKEVRQISRLSATKLGLTGTLRYRKEWWHARFWPGIGTEEIEKKWGFEKKSEQSPLPASKSSNRPMHDIICADCKNPSRVPFQPDPSRPVYCLNCWPKHRPARGGVTS